MYCILITGIPASGKSFLAEYLAKNLLLPMFSKDRVKELLFDTVGFHSREEKMILNDIATEMIYLYAKSLMKSKHAFILENNFEKSSQSIISSLMRQFDYKSITINLSGDYCKIYERFCERNRKSERHPGHVVNDCFPRVVTPADYEQVTYDQFVSEIKKRGMDCWDIGGSRIHFDTTDIEQFDWEAVVQQVKKVLTELGMK